MIDVLFGTFENPRTYIDAANICMDDNDADIEAGCAAEVLLNGEDAVDREIAAIAEAILVIPDEHRRRECAGRLLHTAVGRESPSSAIDIVLKCLPPLDYIGDGGRTVLHMIRVGKYCDMYTRGRLEVDVFHRARVPAVDSVHDSIHAANLHYIPAAVLHSILQYADEHGESIDGVDENGATPIAFHTCRGNLHTLEMMLKVASSGPNKVFTADDRETTALLLATQGNQIFAACVATLVSHGADIDWADKDGNTPRSSFLDAADENRRHAAAAYMGVSYVPGRKIKPARE